MCKLRFVYGRGRGRVRMLAQIRFRVSAFPHNHIHKNALVINFKEGHFDKNKIYCKCINNMIDIIKNCVKACSII